MKGSAALPVRPADKFDVFISYAGIDRKWVHGTLKPRLEATGLTVLTDASFLPGKPVFNNIYDAVEASRFTIVVLSPEWLKSEYAPLEGHFAIAKNLQS